MSVDRIIIIIIFFSFGLITYYTLYNCVNVTTVSIHLSEGWTFMLAISWILCNFRPLLWRNE